MRDGQTWGSVGCTVVSVVILFHICIIETFRYLEMLLNYFETDSETDSNVGFSLVETVLCEILPELAMFVKQVSVHLVCPNIETQRFHIWNNDRLSFSLYGTLLPNIEMFL